MKKLLCGASSLSSQNVSIFLLDKGKVNKWKQNQEKLSNIKKSTRKPDIVTNAFFQDTVVLSDDDVDVEVTKSSQKQSFRLKELPSTESNTDCFCPCCGKSFTTTLLRQLHALIFPRTERINCNCDPFATVQCIICLENCQARYFDYHECIFHLATALQAQRYLADSGLPDYCFICRQAVGCKFTLFAHLRVYHFPRKLHSAQCGFCGEFENINLDDHVGFHKLELRKNFSQCFTTKLTESPVTTSKKKESQESERLSVILQNVKNTNGNRQFLIDICKPYACIVCGQDQQNLIQLHKHILWKRHSPAVQEPANEVFRDNNNKYHCNFCNVLYDDFVLIPCSRYWELIYGRTYPPLDQNDKMYRSASCIICWTSFLNANQLTIHIIATHNLTVGTICGICFGSNVGYDEESKTWLKEHDLLHQYLCEN